MVDNFYPPALCPQGHLFPAKASVAFGGDAHDIAIASLRVRCPSCKQMANVFDGVYETTTREDGTSLLVSMKALDQDQLNRLVGALDNVDTVEQVADLVAAEPDGRIKDVLLRIVNSQLTLELVRALGKIAYELMKN